VKRSPNASGTSLTEALLASAILVTLIAALMTMFTGTRKQFTTSEAKMNGLVLAQLVAERIRGNAVMNPAYFAKLNPSGGVWSETGTVVDPASATNASGLALSRFFRNLFNREGPHLCTPVNEVSIAPAGNGPTPSGMQPEELNALLTTYQDYQVRVQIEDDVDLESPSNPTPLRELVKRVTITTSRGAAMAVHGKDPQAVTLVCRIATPLQSLSNDALNWLYANFDGPTIQQMRAGFFSSVGSNPYFKADELTKESKNLLADCFMILGACNTEALLIDRRAVKGSTILYADSNAASVNAWIRDLKAANVYGLSYGKRELAHLQMLKASIVFDTFKQSAAPLKDLITHIYGPLPDGKKPILQSVEEIKEMLEKDSGKIAQFNKELVNAFKLVRTVNDTRDAAKSAAASGQTTTVRDAYGRVTNVTTGWYDWANSAGLQLNGYADTIVACSYLQQLLTDSRFLPVFARMGTYPQTFSDTLDDLASTLCAHMDQANGPTAFEYMGAAQAFVDNTIARGLFQESIDPAALQRLNTLSTGYRTRMNHLADYLGDPSIGNLAAQQARNQVFVRKLNEMKTLIPQWMNLLKMFGENGKIGAFLERYSTVSQSLKLDDNGAISQLNTALQKSGKTLSSIHSNTVEDIFNSAKNIQNLFK
jgi:hypothetical protein